MAESPAQALISGFQTGFDAAFTAVTDIREQMKIRSQEREAEALAEEDAVWEKEAGSKLSLLRSRHEDMMMRHEKGEDISQQEIQDLRVEVQHAQADYLSAQAQRYGPRTMSPNPIIQKGSAAMMDSIFQRGGQAQTALENEAAREANRELQTSRERHDESLQEKRLTHEDDLKLLDRDLSRELQEGRITAQQNESLLDRQDRARERARDRDLTVSESGLDRGAAAALQTERIGATAGLQEKQIGATADLQGERIDAADAAREDTQKWEQRQRRKDRKTRRKERRQDRAERDLDRGMTQAQLDQRRLEFAKQFGLDEEKVEYEARRLGLMEQEFREGTRRWNELSVGERIESQSALAALALTAPEEVWKSVTDKPREFYIEEQRRLSEGRQRQADRYQQQLKWIESRSDFDPENPPPQHRAISRSLEELHEAQNSDLNFETQYYEWKQKTSISSRMAAKIGERIVSMVEHLLPFDIHVDDATDFFLSMAFGTDEPRREDEE